MPKSPKAAAAERVIKHPELVCEICVGEKAITVARAKELLGWREIETGAFDFVDKLGKKIICDNNDHNRPFDVVHASKVSQVILNSGPGLAAEKRRWQFNFENIIISKWGRVCSGQHRLIGLIFAAQMWASDEQKFHWEDIWTTEPVLETSIGFGIDDSPYITRTFDNVKTRTFADVLYTDPRFDGMTQDLKKAATKMVDHAVRMLWARTGAKDDPFSPFITHADASEFLERHPRVLRAVKHIAEENKGASKPIGKFFSAGYASAFLYLMGCCESDGDVYRNAEPPSEKQLKWSTWAQASDFWTELGKGATAEPLRRALAKVSKAAEKKAILIKAWGSYLANQRVVEEDITLAYRTGELGEQVLLDHPMFSGIDIGEQKLGRRPGDPTPEQVATQAQAIKESRSQPTRAPGEIEKPEPLQHDKDGKPPAPKLKKPTPVEAVTVTEESPAGEPIAPAPVAAVEAPAPVAVTPPTPKAKRPPVPRKAK